MNPSHYLDLLAPVMLAFHVLGIVCMIVWLFTRQEQTRRPKLVRPYIWRGMTLTKPER